MSFSMVASHAKRPIIEDKIFGANRAAQEAVKQHGFENVINSTIGAFLDDNGKLILMKSVMENLRNLSDSEIAAYAPISGIPEFLEAVKKAAFRDKTPEGYIEAVATPGGSGAIRHTISNYSNFGDTVITSDWYWSGYKTLAEENGRKLDTFKLFDENKNFNIDSFKEKIEEVLSAQDRIVIILNTPAHNPTGFSLSFSEWENVIELIRGFAKDETKKITLLCDVAYIDFAGDDSRDFMKLLGGLPKNVLSIIAFSLSKGYTLYGMRCGAIICVSSDKEVAEEFKYVCQFSSRGIWSNSTRAPMQVLANIFEDNELLERVDREREELRQLLEGRANIFLEEAQKIGLEMCPYKSGFFISVPCNNPDEVAEKLKKENIFVVPLKLGVRFAPCAVSLEKCKMVPKKIFEAINS